jgi:hypothetical protein
MALFEENYRLMDSLFGIVFEGKVDHAVSRVEDARLTLYLDVVERHRYTVMVRLSYLFVDQIVLRAEPNAFVRLYHDSRQAEATMFEPGRRLRSWGLSGQRLAAPAGQAEQSLLRNWRMNRFLERWLHLLKQQGHSDAALHTTALSIEERLASGRLDGAEAAELGRGKKIVSGA